MEKRINAPLKKEELVNLRAGDYVYIRGRRFQAEGRAILERNGHAIEDDGVLAGLVNHDGINRAGVCGCGSKSRRCCQNQSQRKNAEQEFFHDVPPLAGYVKIGGGYRYIHESLHAFTIPFTTCIVNDCGRKKQLLRHCVHEKTFVPPCNSWRDWL